MLDKNFIPPKPRIAEVETKKRENIIDTVVPDLIRCGVGIFLTGSVAYGQYYSVTPESDIDLQILITEESVIQLKSCKYFQKYNTDRIIEGFLKGIYQQFSLNFVSKGITVECHFIGENVWKEMVHYKRESVIRLRSKNKKASTDFAYSFDGEENACEYESIKNDIYNVGVFPAYRVIEGKLYLCRPITNVLGNAIILFDECELEQTIAECTRLTKVKLDKVPREKGKTYSILNTLPGKNKVSPEIAKDIG